ncbi:Inositol-pentakisphosphate 2-kinase [Fasciolopsis buskii]|uniref:Inositol-pentakisphosphate 2-kinase n=1 Tax=Fasciolopsis buskii TaxID=27845 RepID=A0A8E0S8B3_9TREM|nr:Inositol-pentakisphosphate 2-kinase [Fasciolopsis buski]
MSNLTELSVDPRIPQYVGCRFTRQMLLIKANPAFLLKLSKKIAPMRPEYRMCKSIDFSEQYVIVAPDAAKTPIHLVPYAYGPTISVEIKPKFGAFLQWPATDATNVLRSHASLFCLRQNYAVSLSRWKTPSEYCPCDLFSGISSLVITRDLLGSYDSKLVFSYEVDQLDKALNSFFSWEPHLQGSQENGHFNGTSDDHSCHPECTFSDDIDHRRRLIEGLLLNALLRELDSASDSPARYSLHFGDRSTFSMNCCLHRDRSPESNRCSWRPNRPSPQGSFHSQGSILGRVLATQLLCRMDICYVVPHYERVSQYLSDHRLTWVCYTRMSDNERSYLLSQSPEMKESFDIVENYLISLVARDCSIMLTFQRAKPNCPTWVPTIGGNICGCIPRMVINPLIIDLDPKQLDKIRNRLHTEHAIARQTLQRHTDFFKLLQD